MFLPPVLLSLSTLLQSSLGQDQKPFMIEINGTVQQEIVDQINDLRREVDPSASNMLKMTWSEEAAASARKHALECQFETSAQEVRKNGYVTCGETMSQLKKLHRWSDLIDAWAETKKDFSYNSWTTDEKKSPFVYTQLISYNAYEVGCALAHCPGRASPYLYVCHFCPGGNIKDQLAEPYKLGPPCKDCPDNCEDKLCTNPCKYVNIYDQCETMLSLLKCNAAKMAKYCQASCQCETEIF